MPDQNQHLLALSAQIVAAHTGNNHVGIEALPDMIRSVYKTLADLDLPRSQILVVTNRAQADPGQADHDHGAHSHSHAHNVYVHPTYGQTVFGDHLICMED